MSVPKPSLKDKFKTDADHESWGLFLYEYWFLKHPKVPLKSKAVYIVQSRSLNLRRPDFFESNYRRSAQTLKPLIKSYLLARRKRQMPQKRELA